jgi:hypothetical protein
MKSVPYTSAKRTQRRHERDERVLARVPSVRRDWRCPICNRWFSAYRGRNVLHLEHCKAKETDRIAREELKRAKIVPIPSPDRFPAYYEPTPDATSPSETVSLSPMREPPVVRVTGSPGSRGAQAWPGSPSARPSSFNQALLGDDDSSLGDFCTIHV